MAAVVRVKRRITESPLEAFVLNSKRRREETSTDKEDVSTILKFAGTVQNQTECLSQATKLTKDEAKSIVSRVRKEPLDQMRQKKRDEQRQNAHNERFRIVNCSRTTATNAEESTADAASAAKEITILDIEKDSEGRLGQTVNGTEVPGVEAQQQSHSSTDAAVAGGSATGGAAAAAANEHYVYDLYVPDVGQPELEWTEQFLQNMLRVEPYDLVFDVYRDQNMEDSNEDSDDSNEENHYGNEYPDSDESTGARAMRRAMEKMELEGDMIGEESSDDEDFYEGPTDRSAEEYCHTVEVDDPEFVGDVDFQNTADRYGVAYAKYKKKILKAFENAKEVKTDDEEDDERSSGSDCFGARGGSDDDDYYSENEVDKYA